MASCPICQEHPVQMQWKPYFCDSHGRGPRVEFTPEQEVTQQADNVL